MEISIEYILTNSYKPDLVAYVNQHEDAFVKILKLALLDKQPYSQKAAWLLWSCMKENDARVKKFCDKIINELPHKCASQQRELFIVLGKMDLDPKGLSQLIDTCIDSWQKVEKQPSVRYAAFRLLIKIAFNYPDLLNEIKLLTSDNYFQGLSPTVKKSVMRLVQQLQDHLCQISKSQITVNGTYSANQ